MFDQRGRGDSGTGAGDAASRAVPGKRTLTEALPAASGGAPLPDALGGALGGALGADLGGVRVHTGAASQDSAGALGARAYTQGQDIHFGAGQYDPSSRGGQELIAHEVAHTVQQRGASAAAPQAKLEVSEPGDAHEVEADQFASSFMQGGTSPVTPVSHGGVARQIVQRDPGPNQPQAAQEITWTIPSSLVPDLAGSVQTLHTKAQVAMFLLVAQNHVLSLPHRFRMDPARVQPIADSLQAQAGHFRTDGALTQADVGDMTIFSSLLASSWRTVIDELGQQIRTRAATLEQNIPQTGELDRIEAEVAEEMHNEFLAGHESKLDHLSHALHHINEYRERVMLVAPWVRGAISLAASAHTAERLAEFAEHGETVARGLSIARGVVEAARHLDHAMRGTGAQGAQADIANFETAINAIDIAMPFFEAVPVLGQLWAFYYGPLTRKCIQLLGVIARADDREGRQFGLLEFMQQPRPPGQTPQIPRELMNYFPGGQPVLNVMYPLVNDGDVRMSSAAEQYFIAHRGLFNAGAEGHMDTQSNWHVFHPSTWGDAASSPNILGFLQANKDRCWAMLYGDMPHTLR